MCMRALFQLCCFVQRIMYLTLFAVLQGFSFLNMGFNGITLFYASCHVFQSVF